MLHERPLRPEEDRRDWVTDDGGFTMVEVLVAAVLLIIGAFATLALLDRGAQATGASLQRDRANALAQELIERSTGMRFTRSNNDLVGDTAAARLQKAASSDAAAGTITSTGLPADKYVKESTWNVKRGPTTYKVTFRACTRSDRIQNTVIQGVFDCDRRATEPVDVPIKPIPGNTCGLALGLLSAGVTAPGAPADDVTAKLQLLNLGAVSVAELQLCLRGVLDTLGLGGLVSPLCDLLGTPGLSSILSPVNGLLGLLGSTVDLNICPAADVESELADVTSGIAAATQVETTVEWRDSATQKDKKIRQSAVVRRGATVVTP